MQTGNHEMILVIDFGGQYNQLIARRVRECGVYCEIVPYTYTLEQIKAKNPKGIIFTGGPNSVYGDDTPKIDPGVFELGVPVLGICYGHQLMTHTLGGRVESADVREYGKTAVKLNKNNILFKDIEEHNISWMSHTDYVSEVPEGFVVTADTSECPVAGMANDLRKLYGVQFHPEVEHTPFGRKMISNFLFDVCGVKGDWTMSSFAQRKIAEIKEAVGDKKVLCALSGGVDSSVAAVLVHKAVGKQLTCVFVDHGLLRKDEGDQVETVFKEQFDMNLIRVNAAERFLGRLAGVSDPETKRKIIGEEFIRVFEEESNKLGKVDFLVQGTIYPDVVESGTSTSATIKSHHNVGGLPEDMRLALIEPLRELLVNPPLENSRHEDQNWRENLVRQVQHSQLELVANFADISMRLSQILKLQPGDVLPIDKPDRIIAHVDGVPVLTSQYGTINGQYALRVEHLINPILNSLNEEQPK